MSNWAALAYAQPPLEVELDYTTDADLVDCPSEAGFRRMLNDRLGRDPVHPGATHRVLARAEVEGNALRGSVRWQLANGEVSGERELRGARCEDLVRAMAFAVAVQIELFDQQRALAEPDLSSEEQSASSAARDTAPEPAPPSAPPLTASKSLSLPDASTKASRPPIADAPLAWQMVVGLGGAGRFTSNADPLPEGRAFWTARRAHYGAEVAAGGTWPSQWRSSEARGFRSSSWFGALALCFSPRPLAVCSSFRLERLTARGVGVDVPRSASTWLFELGPRFVLFGGAKPWQASLYVEGRSALVPARVFINGEQVWKSPPWSVTVGVDVATWWSVAPERHPPNVTVRTRRR